MNLEIQQVLTGVASTVLWTAVSIVLVIIVVEFMNWRYKILDEIFKDNSTAASILAGSFVLGIFYTVVQIVTH